MKPIAALLGLSLAACSPGSEKGPEDRPGRVIRELVPELLMQQANPGRTVFRSDGYFDLPEATRRIWIDVGAYHLGASLPALSYEDRVVIAIEPLAECWAYWPAERDRLIGLPVAIDLDTGWRDFYVNAAPGTSSLAKSLSGTSVDEFTRTLQVRKVPVMRLEEVLRAVPPHLDIEFLKTDVQGLDLQVLKSAGEELRRVKIVRTEIINEPLYEGEGERAPGTESEFMDYMGQMGFSFVRDLGIAENRSWLDKVFVNDVLLPNGLQVAPEEHVGDQVSE